MVVNRLQGGVYVDAATGLGFRFREHFQMTEQQRSQVSERPLHTPVFSNAGLSAHSQESYTHHPTEDSYNHDNSVSPNSDFSHCTITPSESISNIGSHHGPRNNATLRSDPYRHGDRRSDVAPGASKCSVAFSKSVSHAYKKWSSGKPGSVASWSPHPRRRKRSPAPSPQRIVVECLQYPTVVCDPESPWGVGPQSWTTGPVPADVENIAGTDMRNGGGDEYGQAYNDPAIYEVIPSLMGPSMDAASDSGCASGQAYRDPAVYEVERVNQYLGSSTMQAGSASALLPAPAGQTQQPSLAMGMGRVQTDASPGATDAERIEKTLEKIELLIDQCQWMAEEM